MKTGFIFCLLIFLLTKSTYAQGTWNFSNSHVEESISDFNRMAYKIILNEPNSNGYLISPGFPYEYYPPNTEINYQIEINLRDEVKRLSSRIILTFEVFHVQPSLSCDKDGLEIIGSEGQDNAYCDSQVGLTFLSEGKKLKIRFYSDGSIQSRGYKIRVALFNTGCSRHVFGHQYGLFTSPEHPGKYLAHELCVWKIESLPWQRIKLRFNGEVDLLSSTTFCTQDYLAISLTGNFKTNMKRICHSNWVPEPMVSFGPSVLLMFRSDCCTEGHGFSFTFYTINGANTVPKQLTPPNLPKCDCGLENVGESERIVGGKIITVPNRYPWMVGLTEKLDGKYIFFCGGVIISKQYILTAAHCIENKKLSQLRVALGAHHTESSPAPVPVEDIIVHPHFDADAFIHDIGLLKLVYPISFDWSVNMVCMPPSMTMMFVKPGDVGIVAGWGETTEPNAKDEKTQDSTSFILKSLEVPIVSNFQCQSVYGDAVQDTILCAGGIKGEDSCTGDSGGPLIHEYQGRYHVIGVVSWGINCGSDGYPGVYTRISKYLDWIYSVTSDSQPC